LKVSEVENAFGEVGRLKSDFIRIEREYEESNLTFFF